MFTVDSTGALNVSWVDGSGAWLGPVRISTQTYTPPGNAVAASNQFGVANQTDVLGVDNTGALNVSWVNGGGAWQGPVRISGTNFAAS